MDQITVILIHQQKQPAKNKTGRCTHAQVLRPPVPTTRCSRFVGSVCCCRFLSRWGHHHVMNYSWAQYSSIPYKPFTCEHHGTAVLPFCSIQTHTHPYMPAPLITDTDPLTVSLLHVFVNKLFVMLLRVVSIPVLCMHTFFYTYRIFMRPTGIRFRCKHLT